MRDGVALLGGSFDPIHEGHLAMARAAAAHPGVSRVVLMPDGDPPHKRPFASGRDRLAMCRLAAGGEFDVSPMEIDRAGATYTVDTLEALRLENPCASLYVVIGEDTLAQLPTWRNAPRVYELCRFLVFSRGGTKPAPVPEGARVERLSAAIPGISSTVIRARVSRGQGLFGLVPPAVEDYIGAHRLYNPPPLLSEKQMRKRLRETLSASRMRHTEGVVETVRALAPRFEIDAEKAALAALLHDCAKGMTLPEMRRAADDLNMPVDSLRRQSTALLHAPVGAALARAVYGVTDPEILHAIRFHNTGCPGMSEMDKLLYVADMAEPGRKPYPGLSEIREAMQTDLDTAARLSMRRTLEYLNERGINPHPDTERALEETR